MDPTPKEFQTKPTLPYNYKPGRQSGHAGRTTTPTLENRRPNSTDVLRVYIGRVGTLAHGGSMPLGQDVAEVRLGRTMQERRSRLFQDNLGGS